MSQIMKAYMGVFIILLLAVVSGGILSGYLQVLSVQDMHARMITEIEDSHFYHEVMKECMKEAKEKNCMLEITLYSNDGSVKKITAESDIPTDTKNVTIAEVALHFIYRNTLSGDGSSHVLSGYAR